MSASFPPFFSSPSVVTNSNTINSNTISSNLFYSCNLFSMSSSI